MAMKAKDLAKKLKVSPATISLVLNNKPGISDTLRSSLIKKINALGCGDMISKKPSGMDFSDSSKISAPSVAYLIYTNYDENDQDHFSFYPAVLEGAEMEARDSGFNLVVLHMSQNGNETLNSLLKKSDTVAAVVQTDRITDSIMTDLSKLDLPYVFLEAYRPDVPASCVCVNNENGIYSAVRYLKQKGHRNIGYISSGQESDSAIERRKHFHLALREYELLDKIANYYVAGQNGESPVKSLFDQFTEHPPQVTSFISENDVVAWHTMSVLRKKGYSIPDDISIIGFDDRSVCTMTDPPLTTIKNYRHLLGREAVIMIKNKLALYHLGMPDLPIKYELPTELIERESVKTLN